MRYKNTLIIFINYDLPRYIIGRYIIYLVRLVLPSINHTGMYLPEERGSQPFGLYLSVVFKGIGRKKITKRDWR